MAKSKTRFNKPRTWTPHELGVMAEDVAGGWVRLHDYNELLLSYKGALCQLDRAAKRIARLTPNAEIRGDSGFIAQRPATAGSEVERNVRCRTTITDF